MLMKNQIPADKSYSEPISDLMKVMKAVADQDPQRDKLLITLLKQGRKKLDQHQKRFYLMLLIDYYYKNAAMQRNANVFSDWLSSCRGVNFDRVRHRLAGSSTAGNNRDMPADACLYFS